jgi:hypothetical protein
VRASALLTRGQAAEAERAALAIGVSGERAPVQLAAYRLAARAARSRRAGARVVDHLERALDRALSAQLDREVSALLGELVTACRDIGDVPRADRFAQAAASIQGGA